VKRAFTIVMIRDGKLETSNETLTRMIEKYAAQTRGLDACQANS
jgi:hypothetical protein